MLRELIERAKMATVIAGIAVLAGIAYAIYYKDDKALMFVLGGAVTWLWEQRKNEV